MLVYSFQKKNDLYAESVCFFILRDAFKNGFSAKSRNTSLYIQWLFRWWQANVNFYITWFLIWGCSIVEEIFLRNSRSTSL